MHRLYKMQPTSPGTAPGLSAHRQSSALESSSELSPEKNTFLPAHDFHAVGCFFAGPAKIHPKPFASVQLHCYCLSEEF